jgi:hypothetical protein
MSDEIIIEDPVTFKEVQKAGAGDLPPLPIPNIRKGEIVHPCHLDRLPDDVRAQIVRWQAVDGLTPMGIASKLRAIGYQAHHIQIFRWLKSRLRGSKAVTQNPAHMEELREELHNKTMDAMVNTCLLIIQRINKLPAVTSITELEKILSAYARLNTAYATNKRINLDKDGALKQVFGMFDIKFKQLLSEKPELYSQIKEVIEEAHRQIAE